MSAQLAEQPAAQALPLGEAMEILLAAYHADTDDVSELVAEHEKTLKENSFLKLQVSNLENRLDEVIVGNNNFQKTVDEFEQRFAVLAKQKDDVLINAEKINQRMTQEKREADQARNEVKDLKVQLKLFKEIASSPKKIRDKIKDFQSRIAKEKGFTEQHKKNYKASEAANKDLIEEIKVLSHKLAVSDIMQLHKSGDDYICLFPHELGDLEGYEPGQVPLLYMHSTGRCSLVFLNDDGEAELPPAPKGGLRPKKATLEHCSQFLRRVKSQNWTLTDSDVKSIAMQN